MAGGLLEEKTDLDIEEIRRDLRLWRKRVGDSQVAVANQIGSEQPQVSKFEKGVTREFDNEDILNKIQDYIVSAKRRYRQTQTGKRSSVEPRDSTAPSVGRVLPPTYFGDTECPNCRKWVPGVKQGFGLCGVCGWEIGTECQKCGEMNDAANKMCRECGAALHKPAETD